MRARPDSGGERTLDIDLGPADGSSGLAGLGAEMRTILTHVVLHDTDPGDRPPSSNGGNGERHAHGQAGRYQLLGEIARGGMGSVLRGRDPDLGRDLALKVLLDQHRDQSDLVNRFLEEAQICGQLQHPGVVPVYDLGTLADHRPFFAMKLVKGQTLAALLAARSSPADDLPRFLSIFEAICQTMAYAHARGVIHRDLKPSNVMVGSFGEVQVMDWGLAKVLPKDGPKQDVVARRRPTRRSWPRSGARATRNSRRPARCWARRPTWPPSRPGARPKPSTAGPTCSRWARSSARS